jgi:hypothetical protein
LFVFPAVVLATILRVKNFLTKRALFIFFAKKCVIDWIFRSSFLTPLCFTVKHAIYLPTIFRECGHNDTCLEECKKSDWRVDKELAKISLRNAGAG